MEMALYLAVACSIVCELLSGVVLIYGLLGKKEGIPKFRAAVFVCAALAYILAVPDGLTTGCYGLTLLYVRYGYRKSWKDSAVIMVLSLLIGGITELLCSCPIGVFLYGRCPDTASNLLAAFSSLVLSCLLVKFVPVYYLKKWCSRQEAVYTVVVLFCLVLMIGALVNFHMTLELGVGDYIYIFFGIMIIWFLCLQLMKYRYEEGVRKKYFDAFCSVIDQMKRRQHKFQNQLDAVYSLHCLYDDYDTLVEEQRKYMGKLADYEMPANVLVLENPIIIAHLYEKIGEAQEAGLRLRLKLGCSLAACGIDDIHLVEMLGTFLDNAIQDMQETGEREYLYVEAKEEEGKVIRVANPHRRMQNGELQKMFEKGYSTKGEDRGIGLYHVKKLVQKYKIDLVVENEILEGKNYICFSLIMGKREPK